MRKKQAEFSPSYLEAVEKTLKFEGGYVNDKHDPGGATNFGISLRFLRDVKGAEIYDYDGDGDLDAEDIKNLSRQQAKRLYYEHFWRPYGYEYLPACIRAKVFDIAVNMGSRMAGRVLQRALASCGVQVVEDGIIGLKTRAAAGIVALQERAFSAALRAQHEAAYRVIIAHNPAMKRFESGWLDRARA